MLRGVAVALLAAAMISAANFTAVEQQLDRGEYRSALNQLQVVPAVERNAAWHLLASKAYDGLNDAARAVQEAQQAIGMDRRNQAAYLQLAQVFLTRNTFVPAYEVLHDALTAFPDSVLMRLGLGLALNGLQRYDEAVAAFTDCLSRKSDLGPALDGLGTACLNSGKYQELVRVARDYMRGNPQDFRGYYYAAAGLQKSGADAAQTEPLLRRSIECGPRFAAAHALLGKVLMQSGRAEAALNPLREAIRLRPDYREAHYYLATAYRMLGRAEDARREAAEVARLNAQEDKPLPTLRYHRGPPATSPGEPRSK